MSESGTKLETATLAGGCFWCLEAAYQEVEGVSAVTSGYTGGATAHPSYEQVSTGTTGHAEAVQLQFDPGVIGFGDILDIFWVLHDPTTPNRQGHDVGSQYRSMILFHNEAQKQQAEQSRDAAQVSWPDPIVTEIVPLKHFWPAEPEQQNYYLNHPGQGYCQLVINPKLAKLRQKFGRRLRRG
jgi:peptide-methionine (S)-S-oxide reductase